MSTEDYQDRITPYKIKVLEEGEISVLGSNERNMHMGGYLPKEIAPLFVEAIPLENVDLPLRFWKSCRKKMILNH